MVDFLFLLMFGFYGWFLFSGGAHVILPMPMLRCFPMPTCCAKFRSAVSFFKWFLLLSAMPYVHFPVKPTVILPSPRYTGSVDSLYFFSKMFSLTHSRKSSVKTVFE